MEKKICKKCQKEKCVTEFNKNKNQKDGLQTHCKLCNTEYKRKYYIENKGNILDKGKDYYKNNREEIIYRNKIWSENNKEKTTEYKKKYVENNRQEINKKMALRKKNEPILKLKMLYRSKLNKIIERKKNKTFDIIGCTPQELVCFLEKKFKEGMSWENHGIYGWHIDHIVPLSSAKDEEELKKLCHYENLQPLWAIDNILKRDKY
jgi:hypothetical protein